MKTLKLRISDILFLNEVKEVLMKREKLSAKQEDELLFFLSNIPEICDLLTSKTSPEAIFEVCALNLNKAKSHLQTWVNTFARLPYSYAIIVTEKDVELVKKKVILKAMFSPSMMFQLEEKYIEVHFIEDGEATFQFASFEDAEKFPNLYRFKGSWKDAFILILETARYGWPNKLL